MYKRLSCSPVNRFLQRNDDANTGKYDYKSGDMEEIEYAGPPEVPLMAASPLRFRPLFLCQRPESRHSGLHL